MRIAFTGAGLSTASGIPDFRSKGGVWERLDPQSFHIDRFHEDPAAFWERRARLIAAMDYLDAEPNAAHMAMAEAVQDGRLGHIITQNVDGLHLAAGTPPDRLVELHGNGRQTVCLTCRQKEPVEETLARPLPRCACGGLLKPDVVLFGEPVDRMDEAVRLVAACDELLVAGTSLSVYPAAGLVDLAMARGVPVTLCNRDPTPYDGELRVVRGAVEQTIPDLLAALR